MVQYSTSVPMLVSRQFNDEIVLANYENGLYYSLTETGASIWLALKAGWTPNDIVAMFSARYPSTVDPLDSAVVDFIDQLVTENIIVQAASPIERQDWSPVTAGSFARPVLERFDDLRDLLLLDPIHEVGEAGWPLRSNDGQ